MVHCVMMAGGPKLSTISEHAHNTGCSLLWFIDKDRIARSQNYGYAQLVAAAQERSPRSSPENQTRENEKLHNGS